MTPETNHQHTEEEEMIPPITDPLGKHWEQPSTDAILLDDTHALMEEATFYKLADYSCSMPSGVYPGKMWRANPHQFFPDAPDQWFLRWYGIHPDPKFVTNNQRAIIIL